MEHLQYAYVSPVPWLMLSMMKCCVLIPEPVFCMFLHLTLVHNMLIPAILCPNLVNPANGMVVVTGNSVGDNATYTCDPGFELEGATTRTCQSDGTWSGIPPWCESTIGKRKNNIALQNTQQLQIPCTL